MATVVLFALAASIVVWATERPWWAGPVRRGVETRAAFAIRDHVPAFQQWGSRAFTLPNLQAAYAQVDYLTMRGAADDHRAEFLTRFGRLLATHERVDLFVLAHTNHVVDWVAEIEPELRQHLRLVYNTGCFNLAQRERWAALGVRSYVGHVGQSESPVFYVYFLRRWLRGESLRDAVAASNRSTGDALAKLSFCFDSGATAASTFAAITGDEGLRIDGGAP